MSIGSTIKKLRLEKGITQEELAEFLGLTSKAVSQWECDRTAPDISQLPALANIFEVSADVLLGIDIASKDKHIKQILEEAEAKSNLGYCIESAEILRAGLREYPDSYKIMSALMSSVWKARNEPENFKKRTELTHEVVSLGEKILAGCTNDEIRHTTIQLLCYTYPELGETDKAIALAGKMPPRGLTSSDLLCHIYRGSKRFENIQSRLLASVNDLFLDMLYNNAPLDDGTHPYSNEECIALHTKYLAIMDIFFEDENFGFYRQEISWANIFLAMHYMRANKHESAIACLQTAAKHSIISDTAYAPDDKYTCLLFRGKEFGGVSHNITENDSLHQLEQMNDPVFDAIRNTSEFIEIVKSLQQYANKH